MNEACEECGKSISKRAKANVWRGQHIVCTPCLNQLRSWELLDQNRIKYMGRSVSLWLVDDGWKKLGPYTSEDLIELLQQNQIDWLWKIWRDGMDEWKSISLLFTDPRMSDDGVIRLREIFERRDRPRLAATESNKNE
jgi:hypothetical protein